MSDEPVIRLYPAPMEAASLHGLYLKKNVRRQIAPGEVFVYTNFVASLDGRVAVRGLGKRRAVVPDAIANPRDWRLYQELSAQSDVIVVSGGHARAMAVSKSLYPFPFKAPADTCDLKQWRLRRGLSESPALAILSASLELPIGQLAVDLTTDLYCLTGNAFTEGRRRDVEAAGATVIRAGPSATVTGDGMVAGLCREGLYVIYSVAGAGFMRALLQDHVLDRLYLTQVDRFVGGASFDSLVRGEGLSPPVDATLVSLYQDGADILPASQTYAIYEIVK